LRISGRRRLDAGGPPWSGSSVCTFLTAFTAPRVTIVSLGGLLMPAS
jgi:hypothetical protein